MGIVKSICELNATNMLYIAAISFQLAGALLLICHYMRNTEKQIKESYFSQDAIIEVDNGKVTLRKEKIRIKAAEIYVNRISFIYIAIGYIIGIFGDIQKMKQVFVVVAVGIMTVVLIGLGNIIKHASSVKRFQGDLKIDRNELPNGISEEMSEQEYEEIFSDK